MNVSIANLDRDVAIRNQKVFDKSNVLLYELVNATGCTIPQAKDTAASVCKWLTFGLESIAKGLIQMDVQSYFKFCVEQGYVRGSDGWLNLNYGIVDGVFKTDLADKFNIQAKAFATYAEFMAYANTQTEFLGTLRIVSKTGGKHSLICYKGGGNLYISDTSYRGIHVLFSDHIDVNNFIYYTEMIVG